MSNNTADIRQTFLDFFYSKGHLILEGSALVPHDDSTLLFTNAGMNQFKNVFLGIDTSSHSRIATCQHCVRAGGKHNDLENVGYTERHHTFFEMLGNFSFGEYFKYDAIQFAWELLTDKKWFNITKENLWVTVYNTDEETFNIWSHKIGIPQERIIRIGDNKGEPFASDNFWQMGDTGPCGPCTEIFYDYGDHIKGGPPGSLEENGNRYIEIWNIVFMQFNRQSNGTMLPLFKPSVDTGMGLERIASVLQYVNSNYEIDIFRMLIAETARIINYNNASILASQSLRVIADHIRSCTFLISEGVLPSNEGRGYVLRRIIRRAVRHGNMIGVKETFFYKLVMPLIEIMGATANVLKPKQLMIEKILKTEEEQFSRTLKHGLALLDKELPKLVGNTLHSEIAFRLHDTYGFPIDLITEVCLDYNIKLDNIGFEILMEKQRCRAREFSSFRTDSSTNICVNDISKFSGYDQQQQYSSIIALIINGRAVSVLNAGENGIVILNETPFYAESGGQVGDQGELTALGVSFLVHDTQKYGLAISHHGIVKHGKLKVGDNVLATINAARRLCICLNHSATHLLHAALLQVIGNHISQKGSLVSDQNLRFDISHFTPIQSQHIYQIESMVNAKIRLNLPIKTNVMDVKTAKTKGLISLSNQRYNQNVRVLSIGEFSTELCCGTHARQTGDIGLFRIVSETGIAAGVRRIEAVTGEYAISMMHKNIQDLHKIASLVKSDIYGVVDKINTVINKNNKMTKELQYYKNQQAMYESISMLNRAIDIKGIKLLVKYLNHSEIKTMRTIINELKYQLGSSVVFLATTSEGKISLIAGVTKDLVNKVRADDLVNMVAYQISGRGGGHSELAMGGGSDIHKLSQAMDSIKNWIINKL
ncbi:alanine--tRNA ligase [Candidatus Profftia sp. (ex Adelges kitamiensis)]|uniref:alanine--tRNA ligase n=1 Tax=Candidatus Profftia sp. (ex Adelges kitamiensis) TaxID=2864218 RepID=UPI001CE27506|nr:alanine--tRNA ligase [Candidatus Profftia sp. (ex Adelges kitamiensis)]